MNEQELLKMAADFLITCEDNYINEENAISEDMMGVKIFEAPLFGFGDAGDEYFVWLRDAAAIGSHFMLPSEWLAQAKTVISYFLPYTATIKKSNRQERPWPSTAWLHGRYEGQMLLNKLTHFLQTQLIAAGQESIAPSLDKRLWVKVRPDQDLAGAGGQDALSYTSNWSERHVAFVCGLGTFGLSRGLITAKGMAGRFGSIVTELSLEPTERKYEDIHEYCSMCGACIEQCPVQAISYKNGKDHTICCDFLDAVKEKYAPRYACGKCQVGVPCESCIPGE